MSVNDRKCFINVNDRKCFMNVNDRKRYWALGALN